VKLHLLDLGGDIAGNGLSKLFLTIAAAFAEASATGSGNDDQVCGGIRMPNFPGLDFSPLCPIGNELRCQRACYYARGGPRKRSAKT
jgi:hypothetical protein